MNAAGLKIGVAGAEHRTESCDLHLAPFFLARLLVMTVVSNHFQRAFAINFLFQPSQCFLDGLAFFELYLCQTSFTSSPNIPRAWLTMPSDLGPARCQGVDTNSHPHPCQRAKSSMKVPRRGRSSFGPQTSGGAFSAAALIASLKGSRPWSNAAEIDSTGVFEIFLLNFLRFSPPALSSILFATTSRGFINS